MRAANGAPVKKLVVERSEETNCPHPPLILKGDAYFQDTAIDLQRLLARSPGAAAHRHETFATELGA